MGINCSLNRKKRRGEGQIWEAQIHQLSKRVLLNVHKRYSNELKTDYRLFRRQKNFRFLHIQSEIFPVCWSSASCNSCWSSISVSCYSRISIQHKFFFCGKDPMEFAHRNEQYDYEINNRVQLEDEEPQPIN